MKKPTYDQEDELFRKTLKKRRDYSPSAKDRELFETWIQHLDKDKAERQAIIQAKEEQYPTQKEANTGDWDAGKLFIEWMNKNSDKIHQYAQHKVSSPQPTPSGKNKSTAVPTIDLHGYTKDNAMVALKQFIKNLPANTKKVRIIHGKGLSLGKPSIIRQEVRAWLSYQKKHYQWILDFSYESPENGGHGATIVWIKQGEFYEKY